MGFCILRIQLGVHPGSSEGFVDVLLDEPIVDALELELRALRKFVDDLHAGLQGALAFVHSVEAEIHAPEHQVCEGELRVCLDSGF